jgi:hypothetical protein
MSWYTGKEVFVVLGLMMIVYLRVSVWQISVFVKQDLLDQDVIQQIFVQHFLVLTEVHVFERMKNLMVVVVVHLNILDQHVAMIHVAHHHV